MVAVQGPLTRLARVGDAPKIRHGTSRALPATRYPPTLVSEA